jgi:DNA-binding NarL/FixJ family response regulator
MKKTVFVFGMLVLLVLVLFQISKYSILSGNASIEIIIGLIAIIFLIIGIVLNKKSLHITSATSSEINHKKIKQLGITNREYQVLCEIANGHSNQEIASKLFLSESTIKTHVSSILLKLEAKRRTQAVQKAKELQIISK